MIAESVKPRVTRGRAGLWAPGHPMPGLIDMRGHQPTEEAIGIAFARMCGLESRRMYPGLSRILHVPNGGARSRITGAKLKAQGTRRGVPDYFLPVPVAGYHGLWIELKRHDGGLDPAQRAELEALAADGYAACCAWGSAAAMAAVHWYLKGCEGRPPWETAAPVTST